MLIATLEKKPQTLFGISECCKMQGNPMTSFVYRLLYATGFVYRKSISAIHNQVSSNLNSHKLSYFTYWLFQAPTKRHKTGSYS